MTLISARAECRLLMPWQSDLHLSGVAGPLTQLVPQERIAYQPHGDFCGGFTLSIFVDFSC